MKYHRYSIGERFLLLFSFFFFRSTSTIGGYLHAQRTEIKILNIGNSYTNDATTCLPTIVESLGTDLNDICIYNVIRAGATFKYWYKIYHNIDIGTYAINKVIGGLSTYITEGTGEPYDGSLFRSLLIDEKWDIIIIHQYSGYATLYDEWSGNENDGYLDKLLDIIKYHQPNCSIAFMLIHSYASSYSGNKEHSSFERWKHIVDATKRFVNDYDVELVIPYGTAIQNLRMTEYNNELELTRDGSHLGVGLAQYTAACCYYETIIAPRTGVSILGKDIKYQVEDEWDKSQISVTSDNMETAQKAAILACQHPYNCLNPNDYTIESLLTDISEIKHNQTCSSIHTGDEYYSVEGQRLNCPQKGVNIIKRNQQSYKVYHP